MMNIPLPGQPGEAFGQGMNTGMNLYNTMMHPRLTREGHQLQNYMQTQRMAQEKMLEEARLAQAWQQHLQNLAIHQSQEARLQALHPYQLQNLQAQIAHEAAKAQEIQRNQELMNQLLGGNFGQQQPQATQPEFQPYQPPMQPQFQVSQQMPGISNMSQVGQFPNFQAPMSTQGGMNVPNKQAILEGLAKKRLGFNPFEKTEEQKAEQRMNEFIAREDFKRQMKSQEDLTRPTQATITKNQEIITAGNSVLPLLEKLKNEESYPFFSLPSGGKSKYKTRAGLSTDKMMTALDLPNQKESILMVKQMTHREPNESAEEFSDRIQMVIDEIKENIHFANEVITTGKVNQKSAKGKESKNTNLVFNPVTGKLE